MNRKLMEDIQAEEEKVNHVNKLKQKLEQQVWMNFYFKIILTIYVNYS